MPAGAIRRGDSKMQGKTAGKTALIDGHATILPLVLRAPRVISLSGDYGVIDRTAILAK
jgi:hypothetical protein